MDSSTSPISPVADQMLHALDIALRLPRANRTIFDFLFAGLLESPFHRSHVVSPSALSTSLSFRAVQDLNSIPNSLYPPAAASTPFPKHMVAHTPPPGLMRSQVHKIYIPIASVAPYVMGYVLGHDPNHETVCFRANPFAPPWAGRFAFNTTTEDLLHVNCAGTPLSIGLLASVSTQDSCTEHYLIAVPPIAYEWPHLPTTPLWMMSHIRYRTRSAEFPVGTSSPADDDTPFSPNNDTLSALDSTIQQEPFPSRRGTLPDATVSLQPWIMSPGGQLADGTWATGGPGSIGTAGSAFDGIALLNILPILSKALGGSFYAPSLRMDAPQISEAGYSSTFTGRVMETMSSADSALGRQLQERFSSLYYMSALTISADAPLFRQHPPKPFSARLPGCPGCMNISTRTITTADSLAMFFGSSTSVSPEFSEKIDDESFRIWLSDEAKFVDDLLTKAKVHRDVINAESGSKRSELVHTALDPKGQVKKLRLRPLAPRHIQAPLGAGNRDERTILASELGQPKCKCHRVEFASRDEMLAARRQRNRLSAARSNERKKLRIERLERDVAQIREKTAQLQERKQRVQNENHFLKSQLFFAIGNNELSDQF